MASVLVTVSCFCLLIWVDFPPFPTIKGYLKRMYMLPSRNLFEMDHVSVVVDDFFRFLFFFVAGRSSHAKIRTNPSKIEKRPKIQHRSVMLSALQL